MERPVRALLIAILTLTACEPRVEQASAPTHAEATASVDPSATSIVAPSPTLGPSPTDSPVATAAATQNNSSPPAPKPPTATPPPTPSPTVGPVQTPSPTPAQTRVPNSDALPTPHGLPATDGCLTYGAQAPYISFVDCVVHGLPPAAAVTLTANGEVVFLRIGSTVVFPDGSWYFPWSETQHKEIVFVVTAGGVSRSITQVFR